MGAPGYCLFDINQSAFYYGSIHSFSLVLHSTFYVLFYLLFLFVFRALHSSTNRNSLTPLSIISHIRHALRGVLRLPPRCHQPQFQPHHLGLQSYLARPLSSSTSTLLPGLALRDMASSDDEMPLSRKMNGSNGGRWSRTTSPTKPTIKSKPIKQTSNRLYLSTPLIYLVLTFLLSL